MYEAITAGDKDFTALITKMKNAGIDLIYLGGYPQGWSDRAPSQGAGHRCDHDVG